MTRFYDFDPFEETLVTFDLKIDSFDLETLELAVTFDDCFLLYDVLAMFLLLSLLLVLFVLVLFLLVLFLLLLFIVLIIFAAFEF